MTDPREVIAVGRTLRYNQEYQLAARPRSSLDNGTIPVSAPPDNKKSMKNVKLCMYDMNKPDP